MKPVRVELNKESIDGFKSRNAVAEVIDRYSEMLEELFLIRNPRYRFDRNYRGEFKKFLSEHTQSNSLDKAGAWFYFPWNKLLVHYLPDEMHQELRTARNKNLITKDEQKKFYDFKVGIAGLSVGSHPALTIAMMGGGRVMKVADPDEISGSNLNRIPYDFTKIGKLKCALVVEHLYQLNPYAEIHEYPKGIVPEAIDEFLAGPPKLDVLVEEVDNLEMKIRLRLKARELGIPVIMATDNGDNIIVDIERYDLDHNIQLFNGAAGNLTLEEFQKFSSQELPRLATKIAGPKVVVPRMLSSILEVGRTLYSWPQLGDAATLCGVAIAYVARRLALGKKVKSGKIDVNLDFIFDPDYSSQEASSDRVQERQKLLKIIGLDY